ncbi:MAG: hypothetical protein RL172_3068 [Bacteroidota bacterium]|jgi:uncharacterized protein
MQSKKTLVLGASTNPARYSYLAIMRLREQQHSVVAIGKKAGWVKDVAIQTGQLPIAGIHSITLYLNPQHQVEYYQYILSLRPQRIIFNPGTENDELYELAKQQGIQVLEACTLVMLSTQQY